MLDGDLLGIPARHDTAQEAMDALATRQVLDMIAALPPHQAEAVLLRVVAGLDGSTVARMLGKQPSAVRMASYRGLKRLARALPPGGHLSWPTAGVVAGRHHRRCIWIPIQR